MIGISSTPGTVIRMFSYRRAEEYPFFCFAVLYNLLSQVPVLFPQKKKKNSKKEGKGDSKHKKKFMLFFIAFHISLPLDFSLLSSVLLFELNHKFLPR